MTEFRLFLWLSTNSHSNSPHWFGQLLRELDKILCNILELLTTVNEKFQTNIIPSWNQSLTFLFPFSFRHVTVSAALRVKQHTFTGRSLLSQHSQLIFCFSQRVDICGSHTHQAKCMLMMPDNDYCTSDPQHLCLLTETLLKTPKLFIE